MLIVIDSRATREEVLAIEATARARSLGIHRMPGPRLALVLTGRRKDQDPAAFDKLPGVVEVRNLSHVFELASREAKPEDTVVRIAGVPIGGKHFVVIGGPCAVESREQTLGVARRVSGAGGHLLRGGAFKPRTSPYSFQGLGEEGLRILAEAREETGLGVVTEALDAEGVDLVERYADAIQIGARNIQNFPLLKRVGRARKPVLLKRGFQSTLEELLLAAEYVLAEGNLDVVLCERGIRAFSDFSRHTLDLTIVPAAKALTHLPVIVDPSHASGRRDLVVPLARAAAAVGADGVMVEVHSDPTCALCDGSQSVTPDAFDTLVAEVGRVAESVDRPLYASDARSRKIAVGRFTRQP
jgi:3-deoxy-7-phosphoheptulonate synthase